MKSGCVKIIKCFHRIRHGDTVVSGACAESLPCHHIVRRSWSQSSLSQQPSAKYALGRGNSKSSIKVGKLDTNMYVTRPPTGSYTCRCAIVLEIYYLTLLDPYRYRKHLNLSLPSQIQQGKRQLWLLTAQLIKCWYETSPACNSFSKAAWLTLSCVTELWQLDHETTPAHNDESPDDIS